METINNYITINTQNLKVIKNTFMEIIQSKVIYNIESKDDNNKITIEIYKNSYVPLKILHNNTVFLTMLMGEDEEHNNTIEEYIKQFTENSIKEAEETETIKIKQTRQQRRKEEREKAKNHIVSFINYINSIKIIDYKAMELIKYIDKLSITDDEKISLFNTKYNKYKKPYIWHITDTTIEILKTA